MFIFKGHQYCELDKQHSELGGGCHHFQQTAHQPGMVANPDCDQLNRENGTFTVPVCA